MLLHRREDAEAPLHTSVVVITDVILDHVDQFLLAGEALSVVSLPFQNAPEAFHWSIVNTLGHAGHTLGYAGLLQFVVEGSVGILKSSVAME